MKKHIFGDNRGLSLIELIVVVLIIGILATTTSMAISIVYNADAKRSAQNICTVFTQARAKALALGSEDNNDSSKNVTISLELTLDDDDYYYARIYQNSNSLKTPIYEQRLGSDRGLGKSGLQIKAGPKNSDVSNQKKLVNRQPGVVLASDELAVLEYTFSRGSGGIKKAGVGTLSTSDDYYIDLIVDGSEDYKIIIVPATGRCYINDVE